MPESERVGRCSELLSKERSNNPMDERSKQLILQCSVAAGTCLIAYLVAWIVSPPFIFKVVFILVWLGEVPILWGVIFIVRRIARAIK